jgi:hypothetical protein
MVARGGVLVVQVESYFDESGTHDGSPVLCLAGYIVERDQSTRMAEEWNAALNWSELPRPLEYFRMSECAHGHGQFEGVSMEHGIELEKRMIAIIKARTIRGVAVTVSETEFNQIIPQDRALVGSPYSFCAQIILAGVSHWIDDNPETEQAAYFFEAGHKHAPETEWIMRSLFKNERAAQAHRYAGHGFLPKVGNPGVQAADLLSWQSYTDRRHMLEKRPRRKDYASLLEHPHETRHINALMLAVLAKRLVDLRPPLTREEFFFGEKPA